MVAEDLRPSAVLTRQAFENAIRVNGAIGGSTNAVIHLLAIAGRIGVDLTLDDWDRCGRDVPTLADLMPSGRFLMEDFCYAGGLPALMNRLRDVLSLDEITVTGQPLRAQLEGREAAEHRVREPVPDVRHSTQDDEYADEAEQRAR
jgi:dihydroxy-acid dehydratase